jgi:predicted transport protein
LGGSIKVQIEEIQDQRPFCKRSVNLGTQLSEISDEIEEIRSLIVIQGQNKKLKITLKLSFN